AELARRILAHRCVTIFGPGGSGKTSLMGAAVIPVLVEEHACRVVIVDGFAPSAGPLQQLSRALFQDLQLGAVPGDLRAPRREIEALDQALSSAQDRPGGPIVIYLDQIEQIVSPERSEDDARALVEALDRMANKPIQGLHVVLSLREDHLDLLRERARGLR